MKSRFYLAGGLGIFAFCLLSSGFGYLQANRSWILFDSFNNNQVFYTFNSKVMAHDFKTQKSEPIFAPDYRSGIEALGDLATNDPYYWNIASSGPSLEGSFNGFNQSELISDNSFWCTGSRLHGGALLKFNSCGYDIQNSSGDIIFLTQKADAIGIISKLEDVLLIDIKSKQQLFKLSMERCGCSFSNLNRIDMTDDGSVVAMNFYKGGGLWIWQPYKNEIYEVYSGLGGDHFGVFTLSSDGQYLCTSFGHGVELWNIQARRFEIVFRWDKSIKDFSVYTCPPKVTGWVFDRNIYYRTGPDFFFNPDFYTAADSMYKIRPDCEVPSFWGSVSRFIFSADSKLIYMLTRMKGYFGDMSEWGLRVYSIEGRAFVKTIDLPQIKAFPVNIAVSPGNNFFVILDLNGDLLHIPLN